MATVTKPIALDESLNTTEQTPRNIADVLAQELSRITGRNASQVEYDNTESGLTAENVQDALDEIAESVPTLPSVDIQTAVDEFETYNGGLLSECKVSLSPNQDLHGYSEPWVGGASKNILPTTVADLKANNTGGTWSGNAYTVDGVEFAILTDDAENVLGIKVTRKASSGSNVIFNVTSGSELLGLSGESLIINGAGLDSSGDMYLQFYLYDGTNVISPPMGGDSAVFTANPNANSKVRIVIRTVANPNGVIFRPMIRLSSVADPTFEPYSNICPISGHTQVEVENVGKNKLPNEATSQTVNGVTFDINNDGSITLDGQSTADWTGITLTSAKFLKAGTYTVSCPRVNSVDTRLIISYDGAEKVNTYNVDYKTFTLSEDKIISVRFVIRNSGVSFSNVTYYPMIELGSTATPYEPYNGYQVTVNLGGTYYSGTLDVVTGVFVPDKGIVDDASTLTWIKNGSYNNIFYAYPSPSNLKIGTAGRIQTICSDYKSVASNDFSTLDQYYDHCIAVQKNASTLVIVDSTYSSASDLTSALSGVQIVYELATPTPIQLSPTMVKALVGENHLSAPLDGQEITESKYRELFTWDEVESYVNAHSGGGSGMNYSTNEQVVGTWINSKPLYQKTITHSGALTVDNTFSNDIGTLANVDQFVKCEGYFRRTDANGLMYSLNGGTRPEDGADSYKVTTRFFNGQVQVAVKGYNDIEYIALTVQYTKTTD